MKSLSTTFLLVCFFITSNAQYGEPSVKAPFENLDEYCVNDWWNHAKSVNYDPQKIVDVDVPRDQVICFGIYTTQIRSCRKNTTARSTYILPEKFSAINFLN